MRTWPAPAPVTRIIPRLTDTPIASELFGLGSSGSAGSLSIQAAVPDFIQLYPFRVDRRATLRTMAVGRLAAGGTGITCILGVYDSAAGSDIPAGEPILTAGELDVSTTGTKIISGLTLRLDPGRWYWAAHWFTGTGNFRSLAPTSQLGFSTPAPGTSATQFVGYFWAQAYVSGPLPTVGAIAGLTAQQPGIFGSLSYP